MTLHDWINDPDGDPGEEVIIDGRVVTRAELARDRERADHAAAVLERSLKQTFDKERGRGVMAEIVDKSGDDHAHSGDSGFAPNVYYAPDEAPVSGLLLITARTNSYMQQQVKNMRANAEQQFEAADSLRRQAGRAEENALRLMKVAEDIEAMRLNCRVHDDEEAEESDDERG